MSTTPVVIDSGDIDEINGHLERIAAQLIQLGSGPMHLNIVRIPPGLLHVASMRSGCPAVLRGVVPEGTRLLLRGSPASVPFRVNGQAIAADQMVFVPAGGRLTLYLPENCALYAFLRGEPGPHAKQSPAADLAPSICVPTGDESRALGTCVALMTTARACVTNDHESASGLQSRIQEALAPVVSKLWNYATGVPLEAAGRQIRVSAVMRACDFMEKQLHVPLTLQSLCKAAAVRERTLEYGFHECFEVGPMSYLRSLRLCRVRRELMMRRAREPAVSVAAAARRWSFTHMGQFGRDYRLLFGETPSATLARTIPRADRARRAPNGARQGTPDRMTSE